MSGYSLEVNTNSDFTGTVIVDNSTLIGSQYQMKTEILDNTTYYWRVKTKNADAIWGDWGSTWYPN